MSNFFNSKIRILGFIFGLVSACAIIGCSVMLSLGDKMTVDINRNLNRERERERPLIN